jgi:glycosyltransferase involved in cell wall biosynthesis
MQKLNMMCPINFTGYGITSFNIYKCLREKLDICLFPIGQAQVDSDEYSEKLKEDIAKQNTFNNEDTFFKIWHQFDLASRIGNKKYGALTFFEIDKLKNIETRMINNMDVIFVASDWAKDVLESNDVTIPIVVSPLGIDPKIFNEDVNTTVSKETNKYVFLNIGKWEIRKGHDLLVEIFNDAFTENDNVELWMLNHNPFLSTEENNMWIGLYKNSKLGSKIKVFPRINTHSDVAKLIALSDCGIFPARAEGWNNEVPEFFALNKPVILTDYSAHTQYANQDNAYLIDISNVCAAKDGKFFNGFGNWADIGDSQIEQTIEHMRYVYKNDIRTNPSGVKMAKTLTWSNTADIIYNHLYG